MYKRPHLRAQLDDHKPASDESALECRDPSRTQQSFLEDTDINTILERFMKTNLIPTIQQLPRYDDFTQVTDYQSAMNATRAAQDAFMQLPAKTRARFDNDPGEFAAFCLDENNRDELKRMGLLKDTPDEPKAHHEPPKPPETGKKGKETPPKDPPQ